MSIKIVFLNGPPRSGKDTAAGFILQAMTRRHVSVKIYHFADMLKEAAHRISGLSLPPTAFERCKDEPNPNLPLKPDAKPPRHYTPRELYIMVSEEWIKPKFGRDFFGKLLCREIERDWHSGGENLIAVIADSGFQEEARPIIESFEAENCILTRLFRFNTSFSNDSREYWIDQGIPVAVNLYNSMPIEDLADQIEEKLIPFLLPRKQEKTHGKKN